MLPRELKITDARAGRNGQVVLTAKLDDEPIAVSKINITEPSERAEFAASLCAGCPAIDRAIVDTRLLQIACDHADGADDQDDQTPKQSQADLLVALTEGVELFRTPGGDSEAFATFAVDEHRETWPVASKGFRRWLASRFYAEHHKAPGGQALMDAINVIAGKALHEGDEVPVAIRFGEDGGRIYFDLADAAWQAVEVGPGGWHVVVSDDVPVRFIRKRGMLSISAPTPGGSIDDLRAFVNIDDAESWALFVSWLVAAMRPVGPYPILVVNGEQGSAKSWLCRIVRLLIDPNAAALRRPPRDDRDLMIGAENSWVVALDNLSGIKAALSDVLCVLATGGGFATRQLYSDGDEKLFSASRPIIVNGIADLATRPDLLDRAVSLTLPKINDDDRRDEKALAAAFKRAQPGILGALLDAVVVALRNHDQVKLDRLPRMADFAIWATAAEPALGLSPGEFIRAYAGNRELSNDLAIEASPIGPPVLALIRDRGSWSGTATELLAALDALADDRLKGQREWPRQGNILTGKLRRLAPNFRAIGIEVSWTRKGPGRQRTVQLEHVRKSPSVSSGPSATSLTPSKASIPADDPADGPCEGSSGTVPGPSAQNRTGAIENGDADDEDGQDGLLRTDSNRVPDGWTAERWAARMRQQANACEATNPARAIELRDKAGMIDSGVDAT